MPPTFLYPILPYRSFFLPFLVVTAIAVPCWLVFRLYHHRTVAHRVSFHRELLLLIFVVYLSGLATATLTPSHGSRAAIEATGGFDLRPSVGSLTCASSSLPSGSTAHAFCMRNARGNVVLFFPLGILLPLVFRRLRFWRVLQIATALSMSIEVVQYLSMAWINRTADVNDVILNGFGACLGLICVSLLRLRRGTWSVVSRA